MKVIHVHNKVKHFIVPHKHNDYKPHLFREKTMAFLAVVSVVLVLLSFLSSYVITRTAYGSSVIARVLVDFTNKDRIEHNMPPLVHNSRLDEVATMKVDDMVTHQYFSHVSPTGLSPWHFFNKAGYNFLYAGENLAINFLHSANVENAWMKSPLHRQNILDSRFKEIGIATRHGEYAGDKTIYIAQVFGTPAVDISSQKATSSSVSERILYTLNVKGFSAVKNSGPVREVVTDQLHLVTDYVPWYEHVLYNSPIYVGGLYISLFFALLIGLLIMIFVEIKVQHPKNIAYAVIALIILLVLLYINTELLVTTFSFLG